MALEWGLGRGQRLGQEWDQEWDQVKVLLWGLG